MVYLTIEKDNSTVIEHFNFNVQETMLLKSLEAFFIKTDNFSILETIINGTNLISRRTIEYFVTKYSNINNVTYYLNNNNKKIKFNVYSSYKDKLKCHKKKYFDPFGRGDRIPFFSNSNCIITTIGQLNFYRWFIVNDIYKYCLDYHDIIQKSLLINFNKNKKKISKKVNSTSYFKNTLVIENQYNEPINLSVSFDI